jgi:hypothetical protein
MYYIFWAYSAKKKVLSDHTTFNIKPVLQMRGRWESNINVWFRFMYSQKWNCAASKTELNVHSPNFHIHVSVSDLYIPGQGEFGLVTSQLGTGKSLAFLPQCTTTSLLFYNLQNYVLSVSTFAVSVSLHQTS